MKIVFLDESTITRGDMDFSCFEALGTYVGYPLSDEAEIIERAAGADAVIANTARMNRRVLDSLPNLRMVGVIATGYNNIDLDSAREKGVRVCNVAGYAANSVPQHTFALILNLASRVYRYDADVRAGDWQQAPIFTLLSYPTFELAGKTLGIVGFGTIGKNVARIAEAFLMNVLAYDAFGIKDDMYPNIDMDTLLAESDIVTLHCPLTEDTRNLIDEDAIAKMKRTAMIINTARGGIIDEPALAGALNNGRLAGAGIDVVEEEPPKNGNVLFTAQNCVLTPHAAWSTVEARQKLVDETAENIKAFSEGGERNVIV